MNCYIGIDIGTSSTKGILVNASGEILKQHSVDYDVQYPQSGWTEQHPQVWFDASMEIIKQLSIGHEKQIKGISFGGQMHGLVVLDKNDNIIRPCILWNDGRTEKQTTYLNEVVGKEKLSLLTGNIAFAGFTAPKLLWMYENERDNFDNISKIMLPKDYISYMLCGVHSTDYSDASGTLLLDVQNKKWSQQMCEICHIKQDLLPKLYESFEVVGTIKTEIAKQLGLNTDVKIIAGAGDNAAAAIGTATVYNGSCNVSVGTSGTIFICQDSFSVDEQNALHSFAHANGKWHLMGCILSAAGCRKWWMDEVLSSNEYDLLDKQVETLDTESVIFLPYLNGERSPHNDVNAKGAFVGLTATTTKLHMHKAVMEGVAFAIRDCLEVAKANGITVKETNLCGGGAKSAVWRQIFADVLNLPVKILTTEQGPSFGASILAMVGCGEYKTVQEATNKMVTCQTVVTPNSNTVEKYSKKYEKFKLLYPALKDIFSM